jgi:coproporphyrinogen III oxidase
VEEDALSKGAVRNVSAVHGKSKAMQKLFNVGEADFFACGLSLVLHQKTQWYQRFMPMALFRNV